jgi:hypothetical protein
MGVCIDAFDIAARQTEIRQGTVVHDVKRSCAAPGIEPSLKSQQRPHQDAALRESGRERKMGYGWAGEHGASLM